MCIYYNTYSVNLPFACIFYQLKNKMKDKKSEERCFDMKYFCILLISSRFLCLPTALHKQNSGFAVATLESAHFHVSWLSDFIFYPKPLYKSLHQSFFYSFITILPSESGVTLHYSTILP